jgi:uncharacterized protein YbcI
MTTDDIVQRRPETGGDLRLAISNAIVGLYREHYGKGPTRSKTYIFENTVLTVLWGGIVPIEKTLAGQGQADVVHDMRRAFQDVKRDAFIGAVEELTGRKVEVFMSQFDSDADVSIEFFQLE